LVTANTNEEQALSNPWIYNTGGSSAQVMSSSSGSGLKLDGNRAAGAFAVANYYLDAGSGEITGDFTVTPASGTTFVYQIVGSGTRYSTRNLVVKRTPESPQLVAVTSTGSYVECGTLATNRATPVSVVFDTAAGRFDVLMDGATTPCSDVATNVQPPVTGFTIMDPSNEGYGGVATFTNLALH
jgi:hypothetical protein